MALVDLKREETPIYFNKSFDIGFVVLNPAVVAEIGRRGGAAMRRDAFGICSDDVENFYLLGYSAAHSKVVKETIAKSEDGSTTTEWQLLGLGSVACMVSSLRYDGQGDEPGTLRFALIDGFDDYKWDERWPHIWVCKRCPGPEYSIVAIQSKQILAATRETKTYSPGCNGRLLGAFR